MWTGAVDVETGCSNPEGQPGVLGRVELREHQLVFVPRFPLDPHLTYTACVELAALRDAWPAVRELLPTGPGVISRVFDPQPTTSPPSRPRVAEVWPPPGARVPANLLRMYVSFDQPMRARDVAQNVSLHREDGSTIEEAFVDIPEGLWSGDATRLTLFVHPGRVKRNVGPRRTLGPVLRPGDTVRLQISKDLRAATGAPLESVFEATYTVGPTDRTSPEPQRWRLTPPSCAGDPLTVAFDERLDREILRGALRVRRADDLVAGASRPASDGRSWSFHADQPWRPSTKYRLEIDPRVEDLAGNVPGRPFDLDTAVPPDESSAAPLRRDGGDVVAPSHGAGGGRIIREFVVATGACFA